MAAKTNAMNIAKLRKALDKKYKNWDLYKQI